MFEASRHILQLAVHPPLTWLAPLLARARRHAWTIGDPADASDPWRAGQVRGMPADAVSPPSTGI